MKIKFITAIYSDLYGSEFGGRPSRGGHYRYSLLSLLKMTNADFLCYTSEKELPTLVEFFYNQHNVSQSQLKFATFDISQTKFKDLINANKNVEETKKSDRCIEVQYSKFHWWWNEDKTYDYYYWIDAGLSHCGIIPDLYLTSTHSQGRYYESNLFQNTFLENLIEDTKDKFILLGKENDRNYWSGTVDPKWYTEYNRSHHIIGGLFGGHRDKWDTVVNLFEGYVEKIISEDKRIYNEENIITLMYYNHMELFEVKTFDIWWHQDNFPDRNDKTTLMNNKSFYKMLEEINRI